MQQTISDMLFELPDMIAYWGLRVTQPVCISYTIGYHLIIVAKAESEIFKRDQKIPIPLSYYHGHLLKGLTATCHCVYSKKEVGREDLPLILVEHKPCNREDQRSQTTDQQGYISCALETSATLPN